MRAIRIHPSAGAAYSVTGAAPASALRHDLDVPVPKPSRAGELLVRVKASTIIRDMLTWPEMLAHPYQIPGHDFAGVVEAVHEGGTSKFRVGDAVFGMVHADRGGTWAEYCIVKEDEAILKPAMLKFAEAAALSLSALTAYQALFHKAHLPKWASADAALKVEDATQKRVLITGASGAVGIYLVQLAARANCVVTAATNSDERNREFLLGLGASETTEYSQLPGQPRQFEVIVDCVGGAVLDQCWSNIAKGGTLISIDSASWNFVEERKKSEAAWDDIVAVFFIVEPSVEDLEDLVSILESRGLRSFIAGSFPLAEAREAYESKVKGRGKLVLLVGDQELQNVEDDSSAAAVA